MTFVFTPSLLGSAWHSHFLRMGLLAVLASSASALSLPQRVFHPKPAQPAPRAPDCRVGPYLTRAGPPPLRFAVPPPQRVDRPLPPDVASAATASAAAREVAPTALVATAVTATTAPPTTTPQTKLMRILPDDTPRDVRAEDVMPYFQLPPQGEHPALLGANVPFTPAHPAGATLPASSATYQQK